MGEQEQKRRGMTCGGRLALTSVVLGVLLLVAALVVPGVILKKLGDGVNKAVTLHPKEEDSDAYYSWLNNTDASKDPASFFQVTMYNLTNAEDVVFGAEPVVQELAPFTYRRMRVYFNDEWTDDNKKVTYNSRFYYDPVKGSEAPSAKVTAVWPTYLALLKKAGGTLQHAIAALAGPLLGGLYGPLLAGRGAEAAADHWFNGAAIPGLVAANTTLADSPGFMAVVNATSPIAYHLTKWATENKVYPELSYWCAHGNEFIPGPSAHGSNVTVAGPSGLGAVKLCSAHTRMTSAHAVRLLVNGTCPLLTGTFSGEVPGHPELTGLPCAAVLMSLVQAEVARNPAPVTEGLHKLAGSIFPMSCDPTNPLNPNKTAAYNCSSIAGVGERLMVAQYLNTTTAELLSNIAVNYAGATSINTALFPSRTAEEWVFKFEDPLLALLKASDKSANAWNSAFFRDIRSNSESMSTDPRATTVLTGKGDVDKAYWYERWQNHSTLPQRPGGNPANGGRDAYWCNGAVPVEGHDDTQLTPGSFGWFSWSSGLSHTKEYPVWVPQLFRAGKFQYKGPASVRGISVDRFHLADSNFVPSKLYSDEYGGVFNLECPQGGPPVRVTEPRYYRVSRDFPRESFVKGVPAPVPEKHDTFLDVDRVSGTTLQGFKRLQINTWVANGTLRVSEAQPGLRVGKLVPALWIEQREELTAKNAKKYKDNVTFALDLQRDVFIGGLVAGGVLFLGGLLVLLHLRKGRAQVVAGPTGAGDSLLHRPDAGDSSAYI